MTGYGMIIVTGFLIEPKRLRSRSVLVAATFELMFSVDFLTRVALFPVLMAIAVSFFLTLTMLNILMNQLK